MTKTDIKEAAKERWGNWAKDQTIACDNGLLFALDMVRQHNEELALSWERLHGYDKFHVAQFIREACPK